MAPWNPAEYGPVFGAIFAEKRLPVLGPGHPNEAMHVMLNQLSPAAAFGDRAIQNRTFATCCLAAAWWYHDFLSDSHVLSQSVNSPSGNYWHALMHRREPDHPNAKYWMERTGEHPIHPDLQLEAYTLADELDALPGCDFLLRQVKWDPYAFVDLCESVDGTKSDVEGLCRQIQLREFELLFHHCYHHAVGIGV